MKLNRLHTGVLIAFGLLQVGALAAAEPDAAASESALAAGEGIAYVHSVEKSRFGANGALRQDVQGPYLRTVGDKAVFMRDTVTGATLLVPNAYSAGPKSAALSAALPQYLTDNPEKHSMEVKAYLLAAGIPAKEVSATHVTTTMAGGGSVKAGIQPLESKLLWYTTHLERSLSGIPVEGSFAFAALDNRGQSISEGVYWPAIPAQVVRQAVALKHKLATEDGLRRFLGQAKSLKPDVARGEAGEVKIVHTGAGHHGAFEARAVYSLIVRSNALGKASIVRLDDAGVLLVMGDELTLVAAKTPLKQ
ncbi:hypothetical protein FNU76_01850 [Chitinimonas arctica]|uniref:Uncharacterized protein n=1 Tax=Chitinimonas arctica TaxID=2594795 RepID=A0A516SAL9_9NEIS|nr:hypothetical protein [Chitinimonas arctica]QDQ25197.1 hypothetical protein FNU76_01850 [Chitinimonas arctica]